MLFNSSIIYSYASLEKIKLNLKIVLYLILIFIFFPSAALADAFANYVEYRSNPLLGSIKITQGLVRGLKYSEYMGNRVNMAKLASNNIFSCEDSKPHTYIRTAKLDNHIVVTIIEIDPAPGHGYGGALAPEHIKITIDNKTKIDCTFGYAPWLDNLNVKEIAIYPQDGIININANSEHKTSSKDKTLWEAMTFINNPIIVTDEILLNATSTEK